MGITAAAIVSVLPAIVGVYVVYRWARRAHRHDAERQAQFLRSTVAPVVDTEPGINLAVQDELQRLYDAPAYGEDIDADCARLWQAIRDEQQKGEQA
jgi:hypothetical protein